MQIHGQKITIPYVCLNFTWNYNAFYQSFCWVLNFAVKFDFVSGIFIIELLCVPNVFLFHILFLRA